MPIPAPKAPDLETIYDVEGNVEPYVVLALQAAGICDVDPERSSEEQKTPRAEVQIHLGACLRRTPSATNPDPRAGLPCAWKFRMLANVATDRMNPNQTEAHTKFRAKARLTAALFFTRLNPRLPFHRIEELDEVGTTPGLINADARTEDVSRLDWEGIISVRPFAWPPGTVASVG